ncbi:MAG: PEP-CTERM sorting domain-containing protein [Desulfuromonadaceae bacterium]
MKKTLIISVTLLLIFIACPAFATPVHFDINAGGFGYETSWSITGPTFSAGVSRMANYSTYSYEWDLNPGPYNLYMTDTWGDGLDNGGSLHLIVAGISLLDYDTPSNVFRSTFSYDFDVPGTNPVPKPSTFLLLGSGLAGLGFYARKKKKA